MNNKQLKKKQTGGKAGPPPQLLQRQQQNQKVQVEEDNSSSSESDHDPDFEHPNDAEDMEDYKPDGYHPVYLGEKFKEGRYIIEQKLGWGHFSTVWLAHDKETETHVALKIQKSKKSYQEAAVDELQLLGDLRKNEKSEKWSNFIKEKQAQKPECKEFFEGENYCVKLLDNFVHYGSHGKHFCSTFEIMGPNLLDLIQHFDEYRKYMKIWLVKLIARQCLIGLVYIHDVCGLIHTDIKPENIMIQLNEDYYHQFIEQIKQIEKKPFSMLYLKKQQQKASKQNAKKDKRKEKKKKKKQEAAGSDKIKEEGVSQDVEANKSTEPKEISEPAPQQQQKDQSVINNISDKGNAELNSTTTSIQKTEKEEDQVEKAKDDTTKKEAEQEESKQDNQDNRSKEVVHEKEGDEKDKPEKNKEKHEKKKKEENDKTEDSDGESSSSSSSIEVSEEELYTLKWKSKIPIALDKAVKIKIVDFGNACWINKHFTNNIQTREYRAPEVILGIDYEQNTDVFSLACMIYELITNDYLFKPKKREGTSKSDEHLALFQESLGKFKKEFALSGSRSRDYFNKNGQLLRIKEIEQYPISRILIKEYDWDTQEAFDIEDFLLPMLNYNPKKRVQASEALNNPWLWS